MYFRPAIRAASSIRSRIEFSGTPMTVSDMCMLASHWFRSIISGPLTPGNMIFAPPDSPFTRCGTIDPIPMTKSNWVTRLLAVTGVPSRVRPKSCRLDRSW